MTRRFAASLLPPFAAGLAILPLLAQPAPAQASDRWVADEAEARAILPRPRDGAKAAAGSLSCAVQKWTLRLEAAEGSQLPVGDAELRIDGRAFATGSTGEGTALILAVPRDALEPLKSGLRLDVALRGADADQTDEVSFSLRGSRLAINTAEERCSLRDMSAYQAITFTPYSSYIGLARDLRKADIAAFAASTASQPVLDAAMAEFGDGSRILFARLCGSSWYYGSSGCNITGFAPEAAPAKSDEQQETSAPGWRVVYDTEKVLIYTDPASAEDGWRDIVTLPRRGAGPGRVWRWNGNAYALHGNLPEETDAEPLPLRTAQD